MNQTLCQAIEHRNVVEFYYEGGTRSVEPFCHGVSTAAHEVLRGYQTAGFSNTTIPTWKLFRLDKMSGLTVTSESFTGSRPDYNPNDSAMIEIFCRV